jgi:hypothetical protein
MPDTLTIAPITGLKEDRIVPLMPAFLDGAVVPPFTAGLLCAITEGNKQDAKIIKETLRDRFMVSHSFFANNSREFLCACRTLPSRQIHW